VAQQPGDSFPSDAADGLEQILVNGRRAYVALDPALYARLQAGQLRL
jgi:hypothetical protein